MSKYQDPENLPEIMERLKNLPTLKEVMELIDEIFPTWFVSTLPRYSYDYESIQSNWVSVANMANVSTTQIVIVDDIVFDDNHNLIRSFSELLTCSGFSVRRKGEIIPCEKCGNALPSKEMYDVYSKVQDESTIVLPEKWGNKCIDCKS